MYVFILKKHAELKGIEWDSDTDSDCEWNILAVFFVGFLHMNNSVNTLLQPNSILQKLPSAIDDANVFYCIFYVFYYTLRNMFLNVFFIC